ncbi:hypothetical protein XELAEV_18028821mg [Xenopus laevis]|uniref:Secreted protein n=1 Tax=Xenopus laevis TaxID=8355 RepID=A0A974CR48_XENLA|nr:hypothetical protein XELAEV_18028821mg [Xenopus laevis]
MCLFTQLVSGCALFFKVCCACESQKHILYNNILISLGTGYLFVYNWKLPNCFLCYWTPIKLFSSMPNSLEKMETAYCLSNTIPL